MKKTNTILIIGIVTFLISCAESSQEKQKVEETVNTPEIVVKPEIIEENTIEKIVDLTSFLYNIEGTYGWQTTADDISYDFFQDGNLHIQGSDGEATMWEGIWKLEGTKITLISEARNQNETLDVKKVGDNLILGDKTYTRYKPQ